jgi:hypothetical protein
LPGCAPGAEAFGNPPVLLKQTAFGPPDVIAHPGTVVSS